MGTALHQFAVFQHDQMIGVAQRGQAMGNRDGRSSLDQFVQRRLYGFFRFRVYRCRRFIEYQNSGVG